MADNHDSVVEQLRAAGLLPELPLLADGSMQRCRVEGDREKRGWYMLHTIPASEGGQLIVGTFGVWRGNDPGSRKVEVRKTPLSDEQRRAMAERLKADRRRVEAERKRRAAEAAQKARARWAAASEQGESPYLARKGVQGYGLRYEPDGTALVPMADAAGVIHGLQELRPDGGKLYWPAGAAKQGHFHLIGLPGPVLLVAEGYATAASLHAATGLAVAVAFDAGNLAPVAAACARRWRQAKPMLCADDDCWTDGNPGVDAASAAALAAGGAWLKPRFADEPARQAAREAGRKLTDFNDLHAVEGLHAVRTQVDDAIAAAGWSLAGPRPRAPHPQGGGEAGGELRPIESSEHLLERFALVYGMSGTVFDAVEHCLVSLSDMRDACVSKDVHRGWAESPARRIVRQRNVGFDPAGEDPEVTCNLWSGWPTQPKPGNCDRLQELLWHMCGGEAAHRADLADWVMRWLAYPLQYPGAKMKTCLVVHGPQGSGKNMFFEAVMGIYGPYGRVIDQDAIEDKFNDWASRKLFVIADEVIARSEVYHVKNKLKGLITGDWIRINPKNLGSYYERNHCNLVFLSNESVPVVLESDDRRHAVMWTPPKLPPEFYAEVKAEIDAGGIAALHHLLLHYPLGNFGPATLPPQTDARAALIDAGKDSTVRFHEQLMAGDIDKVRPMPARCADVYALYRAWCNQVGLRPAPLTRLSQELQRRCGVAREKKRFLGPAGPQQAWMYLLNEDGRDQAATEQAWLTDCVEGFARMVEDYRGVHP